MKLRNKLIPLASCLAIGATVAPMATACTTSEFVDLTDGFIPTISKLAVEGNKLTGEKAEQVYFNAVSENPDILVQDFNWTISDALRAAAENPNNIFQDDTASTSVLNYARQSIKNVKVGKTIITRTYEQETQDFEYNTVSFDLVREQQYTWKHDEYVGSTPSVQMTTIGTTMFTAHVSNMPVILLNFEGASHETTMGNRYGHLGRRLFNYNWWNNYGIRAYIPSYWFIIFSNDALAEMVDPWEISYEYNTQDTNSYVYNDIAESYVENSSYSGTYNDYEKISTEDEAIRELMGVTIGSHYLSDIALDDEE